MSSAVSGLNRGEKEMWYPRPYQVPAYNCLMLDVEFFDIIWKKGHGSKTVRNVVEAGVIELVYCSDGGTLVQHR
jgi:hypothetical protein